MTHQIFCKLIVLSLPRGLWGFAVGLIAVVATSVGGGLASVGATDPKPEAAGRSKSWKAEYRLDRFHIHCDNEAEDLEKIAAQLRQLEVDLQETLPTTVHDDPVHLVIFQHEREYRRYMQHYFPQAPLRSAIFIQDRGPALLFTFRHDSLMTDILHEGTHALLNHGKSQLPLWLDEGLAEYFEITHEDRYEGGEHLTAWVDLSLGRTSAEPIGFMALSELERVERLEEFSDLHYLHSWSWIHFLVHRNPETRQLIQDQLHRHARGESPPPLSRYLRQLMTDAEDQYRQHFVRLVAEKE